MLAATCSCPMGAGHVALATPSHDTKNGVASSEQHCENVPHELRPERSHVRCNGAKAVADHKGGRRPRYYSSDRAPQLVRCGEPPLPWGGLRPACVLRRGAPPSRRDTRTRRGRTAKCTDRTAGRHGQCDARPRRAGPARPARREFAVSCEARQSAISHCAAPVRTASAQCGRSTSHCGRAVRLGGLV